MAADGITHVSSGTAPLRAPAPSQPPAPTPVPAQPPAVARARTDTLSTSGQAPSAPRSTAELVAQAQAARKQEEDSGISGFFGRMVKRAEEGFTHGVDWVENQVSDLNQASLKLTEGIPVLHQLNQARAWVSDQSTQLVGGVAKGAGTLVFGVGNMVAHPVDTVKGLYSLAEHIPLLPVNPLKLAHGAYDVVANGKAPMEALNDSVNPIKVLQDDLAFGKAMVQGLVEPYQQSIAQGKYAEAVGRGVFDIGSIVLTAGGGAAAKGGVQGAEVAVNAALRAERAAEVAGVAGRAEELTNAARIAGKAERAAEVAGTAERVAEVTGTAGKVEDVAQAARATSGPSAELTKVIGYKNNGEAAFMHAKSALGEGARAEAQLAMTAERAGAIMKLSDAGEFYSALKHMDAGKLKQLAELEPAIAERFSNLLRSNQAQGLADINEAVAKFGSSAKGPVKEWKSMLGKLEKDTAEAAAHGKPPAVLGDLNDLNRARIDTPVLRPRELMDMATDVMEHYRTKYPERQFRFVVKGEGIDEAILRNPDKLYKGRINMQIQDVTNNTKGVSFELQLGPKHMSQFWDTPFKIPGSPNGFNIHDTVYKGVATLDKEPKLIERLGRELGGAGASAEHASAMNAGYDVVKQIMAEYKNQLAGAVDQAFRATPELDFAATGGLRERITQVYNVLKDEAQLPEGLRGIPPKP